MKKFMIILLSAFALNVCAVETNDSVKIQNKNVTKVENTVSTSKPTVKEFVRLDGQKYDTLPREKGIYYAKFTDGLIRKIEIR